MVASTQAEQQVRQAAIQEQAAMARLWLVHDPAGGPPRPSLNLAIAGRLPTPAETIWTQTLPARSWPATSSPAGT